MAEEKARILRVLEALSKYADPAKPADIGNTIGETPFNVGFDLYDLGKRGLAEKPNKKKKLWLITDKGRETMENPPAEWFVPPSGTPSEPPSRTPSGTPSGTPSETLPRTPLRKPRVDLFRTEG